MLNYCIRLGIVQSNKNIVFRVDAAFHIGTGHLQRCLTLAKELQSIGYVTIFVMIPFDRTFIDLVKRQNIEVLLMTNVNLDNVCTHDSGQWLGKSQLEDAEEYLSLLDTIEVYCCIVDHYSIDTVWETIVRTKIKRLMVIDDLANRLHECDLLLDQNYWNNYLSRYNNYVGNSCIKLLGPQYSMLRNEFRELRSRAPIVSSDLPKILINFGGVGDYNLLAKFSRVLPCFIEKYNFTIITGKLSYQNFLYLEDSIKSSGIEIMENTENMADLMFESNYAFGACGSTVWERFCLGLNSSLVEVATNQHELLQFLSTESLVHFLGSSISITEDDIYNSISNLNLESSKNSTRKRKIMSLVDGNGAKRVAQKIKELEYV